MARDYFGDLRCGSSELWLSHTLTPLSCVCHSCTPTPALCVPWSCCSVHLDRQACMPPHSLFFLGCSTAAVLHSAQPCISPSTINVVSGSRPHKLLCDTFLLFWYKNTEKLNVKKSSDLPKVSELCVDNKTLWRLINETVFLCIARSTSPRFAVLCSI